MCIKKRMMQTQIYSSTVSPMKTKLVLVIVGPISILNAPSAARLLCILSERKVDLVCLRHSLGDEDLAVAYQACWRAGVPYTLD